MARKGADYIGTMAVQEKHRFDEQRLARFMAEHVAGFVPPLTVEQFKGGQSNPTYRLTDGAGRRYVLRRKPPGKLLPSAHAVDREFRVISALNKTDVPTPTRLCTVRGRRRRRHGLLHHGVLRRPRAVGSAAAGGPEGGPAARSTRRSSTCWRACMPSTTRPSGSPTSAGRAATSRARSRAGASSTRRRETETIEAMDRLLDWLPAHLPPNDETVLVHGDYRLDNMVFHPSEPRVLGVIDWEISTLGDPLAELSYLCMLWRTPEGLGRPARPRPRRARPADRAGDGRLLLQRCRNAPCRRPALWEFYMAYNLFRVSCIRQGVYARSLDGTASNVRAAEFGQAGAARRRARLAAGRGHRREQRDEQAQDRRGRAAAAGRARPRLPSAMRARRSRRSAPPPSPSSPSAAIRW